MVTFKNQLDSLLAEAVLASGVQRNVVIDKIRLYLKSTSIDQLNREVAVITSKPELVMLQAAGVPAGLQAVFLQTYQILQGS